MRQDLTLYPGLVETSSAGYLAQDGLRLTAVFPPHGLEPTCSVNIKFGIWLLLFPLPETQPEPSTALHHAIEIHPKSKAGEACPLSLFQGTGNQDRKKSERCPPQLLIDKCKPGSNKNGKRGGSPKKSSSPGQRAAWVGPEIDRAQVNQQGCHLHLQGCPGI